MNERQRKKYAQQMRQKRAAAIVDGKIDEFRQDGYSNMLNKAGTIQDNSVAYQYNSEPWVDDLELIQLYEGNGLFSKIIDRPAEEAVKHGFDIDYGDKDIEEYVESRMDALELEQRFSTAEKWARLYGGSIIVMLVNDGRGLEEPLDWENARSIEELRVFERAVVQPDYTTLYMFHFRDSKGVEHSYGEPEYYNVFSIYGYFTVHRSRCLVFRNGRLPEQSTNANYRYWGIPEYVKIRRALRECITAHEDGVKLLERSVQAIYKMKNLANMLATMNGEDKVLQRLQVIDMARGILNSIAIDSDGEDYDFKTLAMTGVKDVLDATCNMLSAVTDIPQTILFGRSPSGENSTGKSDMENYYNMVENIQKRNMKPASRIIIDLILRQGMLEGCIPMIPKYKVRFAALWSLSEAEQASVDQTKAQTEYTKAVTAQTYMEASVLDPAEVRRKLAGDGTFEIEEILTPDEELEVPEELISLLEGTASGGKRADDTIRVTGGKSGADTDSGMHDVIRIAESEVERDSESEIIRLEGEDDRNGGTVIRILSGEQNDENTERTENAGGDFPAAAVLIIHNGRILCAARSNGEGICGPGGKVEAGETAEQAAVREAQEEFSVTPLNLLHLGEYKGSQGSYQPSRLYFTDQFTGTPEADGSEMHDARWLTLQELRQEKLFPPFEESLKKLINLLTGATFPATMNEKEFDGGPGSGNFGHKGVPGQVGGSAKGNAPDGVTKFQRKGGKMEVTSDTKVKSEGGTVILKAGTSVNKIVDFAGAGKKREVRVEPHLIKQYGGKKGSWNHTRGEAEVLDEGKTRKAELHWFESKDVGQVNIKVKRFMEDNGDEG